MRLLQLFTKKTALLSAVAISTLSVAWCLQVGSAAAVDFFEGPYASGGSGASSACSGTKDDIASRTVARVANIVMYISGAIAIITLTIGGFMYITSGGDASKVSEAKNTILFTLIGVAVVVLGKFIILFVLDRL